VYVPGGIVKAGFSLRLIFLFVFILQGCVSSRPGKLPQTAERFVPYEKYSPRGKEMAVSFIDVGQGNSIFVESPSGRTLIYDAGGMPDWMETYRDPGRETVVPFIKKRGVEYIDYAVISHAHGDHIGGMKAVLESFEVEYFLDPGYPHTTHLYMDLLKTVREKEIRYKKIRSGGGDVIELGFGVSCEVFNPPSEYYFHGEGSDVNNNSVLLKITYGDVSFLFPGDMERASEMHVVGKYRGELSSNILQASHHGSNTSSTKIFLKRVMPEVAVIPVGERNQFNHPGQKALNNLRRIGAEIYRTDRHGHIIILTDGKTFTVKTQKKRGRR